MLSNHQFGEQEGLFPADHPAMRERGLAEFTPQEFREKPGAWFHGTYAASMDQVQPKKDSAGIHLGTEKAAQDRLDSMGKRSSSAPGSDRFIGKAWDPAGDIHVRRLAPDVGTPAKPMQHSEADPGPDHVEEWATHYGAHEDEDVSRGAHAFGEYYRNRTEDKGSVSIRVPNQTYLTSHREAIDSALRNNQPVHPLNRGLIENHGGQGIDEVTKFQSAGHLGGRFKDPYAPEKPDHDTLLPYKMRADTYKAGKLRNTKPITFVASEEDAHALHQSGSGYRPLYETWHR